MLILADQRLRILIENLTCDPDSGFECLSPAFVGDKRTLSALVKALYFTLTTSLVVCKPARVDPNSPRRRRNKIVVFVDNKSRERRVWRSVYLNGTVGVCSLTATAAHNTVGQTPGLPSACEKARVFSATSATCSREFVRPRSEGDREASSALTRDSSSQEDFFYFRRAVDRATRKRDETTREPFLRRRNPEDRYDFFTC